MARHTQPFIIVLLVASLVLVSEGRGFQQLDPSLNVTLPDPHIVILGPTGVGKSSLANVLIGGSPDCENCTFEICPGTDSCTKETTYAVGNYVGNGPLFTIVDTPGFGDSDNDDNVLIDEMINVLKDVVKTANSLVILFNGQDQRFDESVQQMLREMEALFGKEEFWRHAVLGVSFWSFKESEQQERNFTGQTEEWWTGEMNRQLQEKFHIEFNLSAVFIDSWAKMPFNIDDPFQQEAFDRETQKLWDLTASLEVFEFKTIEDVLNELSVCKSTLEENITDIWLAVSKNTVDIIDLRMEQGEINDDVASIEVRQEELVDDVSSLSVDVTSLSVAQEQITLDIHNHQEMLETHSASIEGNAAAIDEMNDAILTFLASTAPPLGTILPWTSRPTKDTTNFIATVPDGWQLCDGGLISRGPWLGQATPNINGNEFFLRGSSSPTKVLDTEEDTFQDHLHVDNGHRHAIDPHSHAAPGNNGHFNVDPRDPSDYTDQADKAKGWWIKWARNTAETTATMQSSSSGLAGAKAEYRKGAETRPKNMRVMYIMRIE